MSHITFTLLCAFLFVGNGVMLRDVSAEVYERLGFLLNPAAHKNWIYLAGKLNYTYAQVSNFKLFPGQSTQMLLEDWATMTRGPQTSSSSSLNYFLTN